MSLKLIKEGLEQLKHINDSAYTISIQSKTPLEKDKCMLALAKLSKEFPHLSESKMDEDSKVFSLKSLKRKTEDQEFLQLSDNRTFTYAFGSNIDFNTSEFGKKFFATIQDVLQIQPISLQYIDFQMHTEAKFSQDHYELILDCFYSKDTIGSLFPPNKCVQNDFVLKGFIDEDRLAVVTVTTEQVWEESLIGEFDEKTLKIQCSIGHIRNLGNLEILGDSFEVLFSEFNNFVQKKLIPLILKPIDGKIK